MYIPTNNKKKVFAQMLKNPNVEICGMAHGKWIRIEAEAVRDERREARAAMLEEYGVRMWYNLFILRGGAMIDIKAIFKDMRRDTEKLAADGFAIAGGKYVKSYPVMQGQFVAEISIDTAGEVNFRVYDAQSGEEYLPARVYDACGAFVGEVHKACGEILSDIAGSCFYAERFESAQSKRILRYVKEKYQAEPEFLWGSFPSFAVLRVHGKKPWFAIAGRVEKSKFKLGGGTVEVINLKNEPPAVAARISAGLAYPAYHMNKKNWYSVFLDDSLADSEIEKLIDISYALADK